MADSVGGAKTYTFQDSDIILLDYWVPPSTNFLFSLQRFLYLVKRTKSTIWLLVLELPTVDYVIKIDIKYDLQIKVSEAQTFAVPTYL